MIVNKFFNNRAEFGGRLKQFALLVDTLAMSQIDSINNYFPNNCLPVE